MTVYLKVRQQWAAVYPAGGILHWEEGAQLFCVEFRVRTVAIAKQLLFKKKKTSCILSFNVSVQCFLLRLVNWYTEIAWSRRPGRCDYRMVEHLEFWLQSNFWGNFDTSSSMPAANPMPLAWLLQVCFGYNYWVACCWAVCQMWPDLVSSFNVE